MLDLTGHVPPHCYFARLHLGAIPGPSEWSANVTRKGQTAFIENARGDMHARSLRDALEFEHVFCGIMWRMGFREVAWVRWTPNGFKEKRFDLMRKGYDDAEN